MDWFELEEVELQIKADMDQPKLEEIRTIENDIENLLDDLRYQLLKNDHALFETFDRLCGLAFDLEEARADLR